MDTSQVTLVVLDDDPESRKSVAALASSMRIPCQTFASAEEFLDRYDPRVSGCALVDLQLGGMDILELQDRLKALGSTLSVVLISAHADMLLVVQALKRGAMAFLEKPYRNNELADVIRAAIDHSRRIRRSPARQEEHKPNECVVTSGANVGDMGKANSSAEVALGNRME